MAADVITRFKLETTQFDSKLRDAAKGLKEVAHQAELGGKGFTGFNQKSIDAAKALGTIESGANNTKDKLKDLVGSFNDAAKAYNNLSKEQQQSDFGKNLSQSLEQLQQRIKQTKDELYSLDDSASSKGGGLFSGDKFSGMLQVFGGNVMTKLAGVGVGFVSEMGDMVKQGIELAKAGEGVRLAFERLNQPGILDNLREATHGTVTDLELMKAAVKFNDFKLPLEELGTMMAFAQQKAKDTGQSVDYMVDSIVTGLGRKSLMILDNLGLSATEIRDKMKETGDMTKAVGEIIREQMQQAGDYVETAADRATQANVSLQNKMEELGRKFGPLQEASTNFWTSMKIGILDVVGGPLTTLLNYLTQAQKTAEELVTGSMNQVGSNVDDKGNYIKRPAQKGAAGFDWDKGTWKPGYYGAIYNSATGQTEFPGINVNGNRREKTTPTTTKVNTFDASKIDFDGNKALLAATKIIDTMPSVWSMLGDQGLRDMLGIGKKQTFDLGKDISTKWKVGKNGHMVDKDSKTEERTSQEQLQGIQTMVGSLQSILSGIETLGIELPKELTDIIGVLQTITGIVGSIQAMQQVGTWLGLFHNGGIAHAANGFIGGNTFSGDQIPIMVNSGEMILNKAQQGAIASQLEGGMGPMQLSAVITGEQLRLILNNNGRRTGRGEYVTTNFR